MAESREESEDRPLEPTERRLEKAREEGQIPSSRDLNALIIISVAVLFFATTGAYLLSKLVDTTRLALSFTYEKNILNHIASWSKHEALELLLILTPLFLIIFLASVVSPLLLMRFRLIFKPKFDLEKLNIVTGLKRMFSLQSLYEVGKNLMKVTLTIIAGIIFIFYLLKVLTGNSDLIYPSGIHFIFQRLLDGVLILTLVVIIFASIDVPLQLFNYKKRLRMSHEELKQELRETEGSPETRSRLRMRQKAIATSRMMAAVEKADVIVINPDHYSVAIRYDAIRMASPTLVAKGVNEIALSIRSIAIDKKIPIARIPPLARLIHDKIEIGRPIPGPLFEAIAKVLAWAYQTKESESEQPLPEVEPLPSLES